MSVYIRLADGQVTSISIDYVYEKLMLVYQSGEQEPYVSSYLGTKGCAQFYVVGTMVSHEKVVSNFIFSITKKTILSSGVQTDVDILCRYHLRKDFEKDQYLPLNTYDEYWFEKVPADNEAGWVYGEKKMFIATHDVSRFTEDRRFSIPSECVVPTASIAAYLEAQSLDKPSDTISSESDVNVPYLSRSSLSKTQQERLYFSSVIKSCDTFYLSIRTIVEHFDSPCRLFEAVLLDDRFLLTRQLDESFPKENKLAPDEKKYIEHFFLPFFEPESINQICLNPEGCDESKRLDDVTIGEVIAFYAHCLNYHAKQINRGFKLPEAMLRAYSADCYLKRIGQLSDEVKSDYLFWKKPDAKPDESLLSPNIEVFQSLALIFGINPGEVIGHQREQFIQDVLTRYQLSELENILLALRDYKKTLEDPAGQLHFSPDYAVAINQLSALYPIPSGDRSVADQQYCESFLVIVNAAILEANLQIGILKTNQRVQERGFSRTDMKDIVLMIKRFTDGEFEDFLSSDYAKDMVVYYARSKRVLPLLDNIEHERIRKFILFFCKNVNEAHLIPFIKKLPKDYVYLLCGKLPINLLIKTICILEDLTFLLQHMLIARKKQLIDKIVNDSDIYTLIVDVRDFRKMHNYCRKYADGQAEKCFVERMLNRLHFFISNMNDFILLLRSDLWVADKKKCISAVSVVMSRVFRGVDDFYLLASHPQVDAVLRQCVFVTILKAYNHCIHTNPLRAPLFASRPEKSVVFLAGMSLLLSRFKNQGGDMLLIDFNLIASTSAVDTSAQQMQLASKIKLHHCASPVIKRAINQFLQVLGSSNEMIDVEKICQKAINDHDALGHTARGQRIGASFRRI